MKTLQTLKTSTGCLLAGSGFLVFSVSGLVIFIWSIIVAYTMGGMLSAFLTLCLPVISQLYWMIRIWVLFGFLTPYVLVCVVYLLSFAVFAAGNRLTEK
mgnify:CR=1 FL=1|jgi:hypothetical protein